ncbi:MAG: hypothetical protein J0I41_15240 [Filimonas sp.]|nr:hypothetical protein [Filimonas sp.]
MELDDLKYKLKQQADREQPSLSPEALAAMLQKKTQTQLDKIKRSLVFEIIFTTCFIIACAALSFSNISWYTRIYFLTFGVLSIGMIALLYYLWKRIDTLSNDALPVKNNLETLVHILKSFAKRYLQFSVLLLPTCTMYALMLVQIEKQKEGLNISLFDQPVKLLILIASIIGLMFLAYFFSKYYIRKLYGRHIAQLEASMAELNQEV